MGKFSKVDLLPLFTVNPRLIDAINEINQCNEWYFKFKHENSV